MQVRDRLCVLYGLMVKFGGTVRMALSRGAFKKSIGKMITGVSKEQLLASGSEGVSYTYFR